MPYITSGAGGPVAALPPRRIVEFHRRLEAMTARAHQWEICAAAFVVWRYISDDSFSDFKAGLAGLALEAMPEPTNGDERSPGERWDGRFGGPDDRARIPLRLPRLHALFDATAPR